MIKLLKRIFRGGLVRQNPLPADTRYTLTAKGLGYTDLDRRRMNIERPSQRSK